MQLLYTEITQHPSGEGNAVMVTQKATHEVRKALEVTRYFTDPSKKSYKSRLPIIKKVFHFLS